VDKLYWLDHIKPQDRAQVGDKAFYLSRIMQRGYPVMPGFVVSANVWRQFLENINSSELLVADLPYSSLHLDVSNWQQLQQVAGRLRQEIISAEVPNKWVSEIYQAAKTWKSKCLILRPTLTFASGKKEIGNISGLLESVFCFCDQEAIAQGLKQTWSQLFRARSLLYWQSVGINLQKINLAVLVQPVENAIASGVFQANQSGAEIEATYGLGIAITKGEVLPDIYYIQENNRIIQEKQLGNKNIAYSINDQTSVLSSDSLTTTVKITHNNCCLASPLSEQQQKQYALTEDYLQQIIILGNQLVNEIGQKLTIKWTITDSLPHPQLYITQASIPPSLTPNLNFLKGMGAAKGNVMATAYVISNSQTKPEQIPKEALKGVILIATTITPNWLPLLHELAGVITEKGGLTSHAAILSRELGIPAVVSARNATNLIKTGEMLLLNGETGDIYLSPANVDNLVDENSEKWENGEKFSLSNKTVTLINNQPNMVRLHNIATQLLVNISQTSLIEKAKSLPVDGVGLLRSELMILNILEGKNPDAWLLNGRQTELLEKLSAQIQKFAQGFAPRPIWYRSLDWLIQDSSTFSDGGKSYSSSILGKHGTLSYLQNSAFFELELKALAELQKKGYTNINLLLPFVRTVEEFIFCRRHVEAAGLTQNSHFQLWIMAEVPSVLFLLPEYIKAGVAGISIGTNDLTQLILGVDREQGELASIFDARHPAVMGAIAQLIKMAQAGGIPCSICGQAPALYPEIIDKLVEWGITSISVEPEAVEMTYQAIARAEQRLILAAARKKLTD
jgi:pyruvate,water dikinase